MSGSPSTRPRELERTVAAAADRLAQARRTPMRVPLRTEAQQDPHNEDVRTAGDFGGWARRVSNLRPLACEARSRGGRATAGAGPIVLICRSLHSVVA
jgi:hypothetical protein